MDGEWEAYYAEAKGKVLALPSEMAKKLFDAYLNYNELRCRVMAERDPSLVNDWLQISVELRKLSELAASTTGMVEVPLPMLFPNQDEVLRHFLSNNPITPPK